MTYLEKAHELQEEIKFRIVRSDAISISVVEEWNRIIDLIMYGGSVQWDDEYEKPTT